MSSVNSGARSIDASPRSARYCSLLVELLYSNSAWGG